MTLMTHMRRRTSIALILLAASGHAVHLTSSMALAPGLFVTGRAPRAPIRCVSAPAATHSAFAALGVRAELCAALDAAGVHKPNELQNFAIPAILGRESLILGAQTTVFTSIGSLKASGTVVYNTLNGRRGAATWARNIPPLARAAFYEALKDASTRGCTWTRSPGEALAYGAGLRGRVLDVESVIVAQYPAMTPITSTGAASTGLFWFLWEGVVTTARGMTQPGGAYGTTGTAAEADIYVNST